MELTKLDALVYLLLNRNKILTDLLPVSQPVRSRESDVLTSSRQFSQSEVENRACFGGIPRRTDPVSGHPEMSGGVTSCSPFARRRTSSGHPQARGTNAGSGTHS